MVSGILPFKLYVFLRIVQHSQNVHSLALVSERRLIATDPISSAASSCLSSYNTKQVSVLLCGWSVYKFPGLHLPAVFPPHCGQ